MPSGRVHSFTTVLLSAGLGYYAWHTGYPLASAGALAGGTLAGIFLSPDLDVESGSISWYHVRKVGGCLAGLLWSWIWKPYAMVIPHRSPLSHLPLLSTVIRLGYLAGMVYAILLTLHMARLIEHPTLPTWWPYAFFGLVLSDLLHYLLDKSFKGHKRRETH